MYAQVSSTSKRRAKGRGHSRKSAPRRYEIRSVRGIMKAVVDIINASKMHSEDIAAKVVRNGDKVSGQTIRNWVDGSVQNPHLLKVNVVLKALGYRIEFVSVH